MNDEPGSIVLSPYRGHWETTVYPTYRVVRCNCGHLGWLSPQGEPLVATDRVYTQCLDCHERERRLIPDQKIRAVAGGLEAIQELHGDEALSRVKAFMRRRGIEEVPNE